MFLVKIRMFRAHPYYAMCEVQQYWMDKLSSLFNVAATVKWTKNVFSHVFSEYDVPGQKLGSFLGDRQKQIGKLGSFHIGSKLGTGMLTSTF